jgi:hypothetical protein
MASLLDSVQQFSTNATTAAKAAVGKIDALFDSGIAGAKSLAGGLVPKTSFSSADFGKMPVRAGGATPQESKLSHGNAFQGAYSFPADLKYMAVFKFQAYDRVNVGVEAKKLDTAIIMLPMPANLAETFSAEYETPALGPVVGGLADAGVNALRSAFGTGGPPTSQNEQTLMGNVKAGAAYGALNLVKNNLGKNGESAAAAVQKATGLAPNPHLATIFKQVNLRSHSFEYTLTAASYAEMQNIKKIIRLLRERMLPGIGVGQDVLLTFPDTCDISFLPSENTPFKIKRSVLADLTVNYAPQGPAFFRSGDPVAINISMTFKEIDAYTRLDLPKDTSEEFYI